MPSLNIAGLNKFMDESVKKDDLIAKETSKGALRKEAIIANQFANNISRQSLSDDESSIDPYSATPKKSKLDLFKISNSKYQTSLLESLVKNQHNKGFNNAVLQYQSSVLGHLEGINEKLDRMINAQTVKDAEERKLREYKRNTSDLATNLATGNLEGVYNQILTTLKGNLFSGGGSNELAMIMGMLPLFKSSLQNGGIKDMAQNGLLSLLQLINPKLGDVAGRFKSDPAALIQDYIDQLAVSNNSTLSKIFKPYLSKAKVNTQDAQKIDMKALAKFDNKVYTAITKIMPDQLIKQTDLLEALVTGKQIAPRAYDWENNKIENVSRLLERQNESQMTVRKGTDEYYNTLMNRITESLENNDTLISKFNAFLAKDSNGSYMKSADNKYVLKDEAAFKATLATLLQSDANGITQLRNSNTSIDEFIKANKLDTNMVNGQQVKASAAEVASRRQMFALMQALLTSSGLKPHEITEMQNNIESIRKDINNSVGIDIGAYTSSEYINAYDQLVTGQISPEEFNSRISIVPRGFGGSTIGRDNNIGSGAANASSNPKLYKNSQGNMVPFTELTGYEQEAHRKRELNSGTQYGEESFQHTKMNYDTSTSLDEYQSKCLELLNVGIIDDDTFNHLMANANTAQGKEVIDKYSKKLEAASKYFTKLDKAGLTINRIRGNYNVSDDALRKQGYVSSVADVYRYIGNDYKLDKESFRNKNRSLYTDKTMKTIDDINIGKLESEEGLVNATNPIDSAAELMSTIFGDPEISRQAGFVAGGMGGIALSKLLQMMGKKPGLITKSLPVVMATLMTTNYAQRWANNIFGAEGQIKNAQGYSNRDIFMSKLMLKWLPMIGIGAKTTQITAKLMSSMGPLGLVFGVPISLASGLLVGSIGTKMLNTMRNKMFSEENQNNGSLWGMAGKMVMEKFPWLGKYLGFGSAGRKSSMLRTYQQERAKLKTEYNTISNKLKSLTKDPNADPKKIAELQAQLKASENAIGVYSDAIKDIEGLPKNDENLDFELNRIENRVQDEIGKLAEKDSEAGEKIRKSYEETKSQIEKDNNFNASVAADQKLDLKGTNAIRSAIDNMENNPDIDPATKNLLQKAKAKIDRGESVSLEDLFKESQELNNLATFNKNVRAQEYARLNAGREGDSSKLYSYQFRNYQFDDLEQIMQDSTLSDDEKRRRMKEYYNNMMEGKSFKENFENEYVAKQNEATYLSTVINTLRTIYPDMPESERIRLATRITHANIGTDSISDMYQKSGFRRGIAKVKNIFGKVADTDNVEYISGSDLTEDAQMKSRLESYYKFMNSDSGAGTGVNLKTKNESNYFSQSDLSGYKFKDNSPADKYGCALVAFNNMLKLLGFELVDPNTLMMIAENHKTSTGIKSSVFPHLASPLGLSCKIYTIEDNEKFTAGQLLKSAPNQNRGMIILLRDDKNQNNHYITVKNIRSGLIEYIDPDDLSTNVKTGSLSSVLLRIQSLIIFTKVSESNNLKESNASINENESIHRTTLKGSINKGLSKLFNGIQGAKLTFLPEGTVAKVNNLKNMINDGSTSDTSPLSVLEKINMGIQSVYEALINPTVQPVSIYEDQTIPLQTTDTQKAESLLRNIKAETPAAEQSKQSIKSQVRDQSVKKESDDAQKVQDAIIEMAENQKKEKESIKEAKSVDDGWKTGDNQPTGSLFNKLNSLLGVLGGLGGSLAGALAAVAPMLMLWNNAKGSVTNLKDKFFNFFKSPQDAVYDDNGNLVKQGSYRDVSGTIRDWRNIKNGLFAAGGIASKYTGDLLTRVGDNIAAKGANIASKGLLGKLGGNIIEKFGTKFASKSSLVSKVGAGVSKFGYGAMDAVTTKTGNLIKAGFEKLGLPGEITQEMLEKFANSIKDKVLTILEGVQTTVTKIPFIGKYADQFIGKAVAGINKMVKWITSSSMGKKLMAKLVKESGETAAKSVPFLNIAVLVASAVSAVWNGWRHADQILGIPQDTVSVGLKCVAIAAKMIWDVLPNVLSVIMAYVLPGAGALSVDICVAIIQMFIGFPRFLSWFGFDSEWRKEKAKEHANQKQAEKESQDLVDNVKKSQDNIKEDINNQSQNKQEPDISKSAIAFENTVKQQENEQAIKNNIDDNKMNADPQIAGANIQKMSFWDRFKSNMVKGREESLKNASMYTMLGYNVNSLYAQKSEQDRQKEYDAIMNTPEMKAMKAEWEKSGSEWFHPMGDPNTRVTSSFGPRNVIGASSNHKGIDFSSKGRSGEKVYAAKSGKVVTSSDNYGIIDIMHPDGTTTRYMHLSTRYPKVGSEVSAGDVIGLSGGVGSGGKQNAYKPHVHFEIRDPQGNRLDPFLKMGLDPSVINVEPKGNNRENIAYLERHPFLLDKIKNEKEKLEKDKAQKETKKEETPSIKTKEAGDMPRNAEIQQQKEQQMNIANITNANENINLAMINMMRALIENQKQTNAMLNQIANLLGGIQGHLQENLNNDIVDALSSARL